MTLVSSHSLSLFCIQMIPEVVRQKEGKKTNPLNFAGFRVRAINFVSIFHRVSQSKAKRKGRMVRDIQTLRDRDRDRERLVVCIVCVRVLCGYICIHVCVYSVIESVCGLKW